MTPVVPTVESGLIDLSEISLTRLLNEADDSNLALAIQRIHDEAESIDRSDSISAFNSSF
jgi:FXSXX-COOH protein